VNDEDFARAAFRHAMESSFAGEPTGLPNLDVITARARNANRTKQGVYAASAVALAGVVTAGVVAGPSVLGLGGGSPEVSTGGQAGSSTTQAPSATSSNSKDGKAQLATACPNPPQLDWASIITSAVPGVTVTGVAKPTAPSPGDCFVLPGGGMNIEKLFDLSNPKGIVQIDVNTGGSKTGSAASPSNSAAAASKSAAAAEQSKLDALKSDTATQKSPGLATNSPADTASPSPGTSTTTCSGTVQTQQICSTEVQKGGYVGISVVLTRGTSHPMFVQVIGSTSTPAPGQHAPLSSAQLTAIAEAVASHF